MTPFQESAGQSKKIALVNGRLFARRVQLGHQLLRKALRDEAHFRPFRIKQHSTYPSQDTIRLWFITSIGLNEPHLIARGFQLSRAPLAQQLLLQRQSQDSPVAEPCAVTIDKVALPIRPKTWPAANCSRPRNFKASLRPGFPDSRMSLNACTNSHLRPSVLLTVTRPRERCDTSSCTPVPAKSQPNI